MPTLEAVKQLQKYTRCEKYPSTKETWAKTRSVCILSALLVLRAKTSEVFFSLALQFHPKYSPTCDSGEWIFISYIKVSNKLRLRSSGLKLKLKLLLQMETGDMWSRLHVTTRKTTTKTGWFLDEEVGVIEASLRPDFQSPFRKEQVLHSWSCWTKYINPSYFWGKGLPGFPIPTKLTSGVRWHCVTLLDRNLGVTVKTDRCFDFQCGWLKGQKQN